MTIRFIRKAALVVGLAMLSLLVAAATTTQHEPCANYPKPDASWATFGCIVIRLDPGTVSGHFSFTYSDGTSYELEGITDNVWIARPPNTSVQFSITNIQDTAEGFGTLYKYEDASGTVSIPAEWQTQEYTIRTRKTYIRGTLNFTCDIRAATASDNIACRVGIDGNQQDDLLPGQQASYILDPTTHIVRIDLVGNQASLWNPASLEQTIAITAGRTTNLAPKFDKRAHLIIALGQPGVLGDIYVDSQLVATQVPTVDQWITPNQNHKIEAKNITDPAANGVYMWADASATTSLSPNREKALTFNLKKVFLKGFLNLKCGVMNASLNDDVVCRVTIDGNPQSDLTQGQQVNYTLDPGAHVVKVELAGAQAWLWDPVVREQSAIITAGRTSNMNLKFNKRGHLMITLSQPGVVGDLYMDGQLIISQAASADIWVVPNQSHKVEAKNITDPAANGVYRWRDVSANAYLSAGQERTVKLSPTKEFLKGFLALKCVITNLQPGDNAGCAVSIDDKPVDSLAPDAIGQYTLDPGKHNVSVTLTGGEQYAYGSAKALSISVTAGRTVNQTIRFKFERPTPTPTAAAPSSSQFDEAQVRYILADAQLGNVIDYYRGFLNQPAVAEAVRRWDTGVRVTNISQFERKIVGDKGWQVVYAGTNILINGMDVQLSTDTTTAGPSQNWCDHPYWPLKIGATWTYRVTIGAKYWKNEHWTVENVVVGQSEAEATVAIYQQDIRDGSQSGFSTVALRCTADGIFSSDARLPSLPFPAMAMTAGTTTIGPDGSCYAATATVDEHWQCGTYMQGLAYTFVSGIGMGDLSQIRGGLYSLYLLDYHIP